MLAARTRGPIEDCQSRATLKLAASIDGSLFAKSPRGKPKDLARLFSQFSDSPAGQ